MSWYALKSRDELFTSNMLREANYLTYVPCERLERRLGRRMVTVERPVYPGYVFVCCEPEAAEAVRAIGSSTDFVRYANEAGVKVPLRFNAADLAPIVWAELFGDLDRTRVPPPWEPKRNDRIRVASGLWRGYLGSIISVGNKKLLVQIERAKLEFSASDLELAA